MNINFVIKYSYLPHVEHDKFRAMVTFRLPKEPGTDAVAYCYQARFNGEEIRNFSGYDAGEWRTFQVNFSDDESFENLEQKVINAIQEYKSKVSENIKLVLEMRNRCRDLTVDFPDSVRVYE